MLIQTDINELGDKRLSPEEALAKLKEENAKKTAEYRIPNQAVLEDQLAAIGQAMPYQTFIKKLKSIQPRLIIEDGGIEGALAIRNYAKEYLTGFYKDVLTEFSFVTTDTRGLPVRESRGWRSVLISLIKQHVISYRTVVKEFGEPWGSRSNLWHEELADYKLQQNA
jgi:hypothetical protein